MITTHNYFNPHRSKFTSHELHASNKLLITMVIVKENQEILDGYTLHLVWNKSQLPTWCKYCLF